jgi:hypothetical protein
MQSRNDKLNICMSLRRFFIIQQWRLYDRRNNTVSGARQVDLGALSLEERFIKGALRLKP